MSTFQPGMSSPGTFIFEPDTEIITVTPTSTGLTFPDPIPNDGSSIYYTVYNYVPPQDPQPLIPSATSRIVSVSCEISTSNVGNGKATLYFRLGGSTPSDKDYFYVVPMNPFITSDASTYVVSFTGLVKSTPQSSLRLYISKVIPTTDTTEYAVGSIVFNYKNL